MQIIVAQNAGESNSATVFAGFRTRSSENCGPRSVLQPRKRVSIEPTQSRSAQIVILGCDQTVSRCLKTALCGDSLRAGDRAT